MLNFIFKELTHKNDFVVQGHKLKGLPGHFFFNLTVPTI